MHWIFIGFTCIIFALDINGASLQSSFDTDAVEIVDLYIKIWSSKPAAVGKMDPFGYCQVIEECCSTEYYSQATTFFTQCMLKGEPEIRFLKVIDACINSTDLSKGDQYCQSLRSSITTELINLQDSHTQEFNAVLSEHFTIFTDFLDRVFDTCTDEEYYALICSSDKELLKTCVSTILQQSRMSDKPVDKTFIVELKTVLTQIDQKLSKIAKSKKNLI